MKDLIRKLLFKNEMPNKINATPEKSMFKLSSHDYTDLNLCKPIKKYAFVFVCQEGKLEIGSLLLAASLKRFLRCEYELIAAIPSPSKIMGKPNDVTLRVFEKMGVRAVNIHNELVSENHKTKRHLIANKMYCLGIPISADKFIFLDSDILLYKEFFGDSRFCLPFNAKQVGLGGACDFEGKWFKFYEAFNLEMPNIRIRIEYPEGLRYVPPNFSTSFFAINKDVVSELYKTWFDCYRIIEEKGLVKENPYHLEQIAISVAIIKMKVPYEMIGRDWLYSYFYNYDKFENIKNNDEIYNLTQSLLKEYPEISKLIKE